MKFSICLIAKNEAKTLPRFFESLKEYKDKGGEIVLLDTGSTDATAQLARDHGCRVKEVGDLFVTVVDAELAEKVNARFCVGDEPKLLKDGDRIFNFGGARNLSASLASNDMVAMHDCDEAYTKLDLAKLDELIASGFEQFEYNFVFSHDQFGGEAIKFVQSKFYDRRKMHWEGIVHEVLQGQANRLFLDESAIKLEHWQNPATDRSGYLRGLALDCYLHPNNDRNSHYLAREMMWAGRPKSAIREFERHITMNGWQAERAQSMIHIGDCYGMLNEPEKQVEWYSKAFFCDASRREPLIKLANFYKLKNNHQAAICYTKAALEIPWNAYYGNDRSHYTTLPHEILYWAYWWLGNKEESKKHFDIAYNMQPTNPQYITDRQYYYEKDYDYTDNGIDGWMSLQELNWLHEQAKHVDTILEVGSWKGRSTHALLSGCKGKVTAVDTFEGSVDPKDLTFQQGKPQQVYETFMKNVGHFPNLEVMKMTSKEAAEKLKDRKFDLIFIDANHTYEGVKEDLTLWKDKAKIILSGHDYTFIWLGVKQAVDEGVGPVQLCGSIWYQNCRTPQIMKMTELLRKKENFTHVKLGDGERFCMLNRQGANCDGHPYSEELGKKLIEAYKFLGQRINTFIGFFDEYRDMYIDQKVSEEIVTTEEQQALIQSLGMKNLVRGDLFLHDKYAQLTDLHYFFYLIKEDSRKKIYIGPKVLAGIVPFLGITKHIEIPEVNSFAEEKRILDELGSELEDNCIVILTAGLPSKYFVHQALLKNQNITCLDLGSSLDPLFGRQTRTGQLSLNELSQTYTELRPNKIPKRIFTMWLNENDETPKMIQECIESQKIPGYEHRLITLENCPRDIPYVNDALASKKWVKAVDYLRMWYLYHEGGIYLDADVQVLQGKNFDDLLTNTLFAGREENGFIANSTVGAQAGHPLLKEYLETVPKRFRGDDDKPFESSMEIFTDQVYAADQNKMGIKVCTADYFFPYNHQTGKIEVTKNTRSMHHFMKSWINTTDLLPRVTIILPTLGREEGLKRCLDSINQLLYPKHLLETVVLDGEGTVPEKVDTGLKQARGDVLCYAANDMEFAPDSLYHAVCESREHGLVSFDAGTVLPDKGNICEHFVITRKLVDQIGGQIFDTDFHHVGVDNLLWAKADKLGQAHHSSLAKIVHHHFSKEGGIPDKIYDKGWSHVEEDRRLLQEKLKAI